MATNPRRAASVCADGTAWRPRPEFGSRPALPRPPSPRTGRICDPRACSRYSQWPYRQRPQHRGLPQLASDSLPQRHAPPGQYADEITSHFFGDANYTRMIGWPDMIQPLTEDGWTGLAPAGRRISMHSQNFWRIEGRAGSRELGAGGSARRLPAARGGRVCAAARAQQGQGAGISALLGA